MSEHGQALEPGDRRDPLAGPAGPESDDLSGAFGDYRQGVRVSEAVRRLLDRTEGIAGADPELEAAQGVKEKTQVRMSPQRLAAEREALALVTEAQTAAAAERRGGAVASTLRSVAELPKQIAGGVGDALVEVGETSVQIAETVSQAMPEWLRLIWFAGSPAFGLSDKDRAAIEAELGQPLDQLIAEALDKAPTIAGAKTGLGGGARAITTFLTGFLPAVKLTRTLKGGEAVSAGGRIAEAAFAGSLADLTVIDEQSGRLADMWRELGLPDNVLTEYLATAEAESPAEAKFKTALEGAAAGVLFDAVFQGARAIRGALIARRAGVAPGADPLAAARAEFGEVTERDFLILGDPDEPLFRVAAKPPEAGGPKVRDAEKPGGGIDAEVGMLTDLDIRGIGDPDSAIGGVAVKINFARIDAGDDIASVIGQMADAFRGKIGKATRGRISHEQTSALADELGYSVPDLLARRRGQPFNAEEALAARRLWVSSAAKLLETARAASGPNAGEIDQFNFRRMMAIHYAVQAEVIGARTETARALNAWKIPAGGGVEQARAISLLMRDMGGPDLSEAMARRLAILAAQGGDAASIGAFARKGWGATGIDAIREVWINGLLSSPKTHLVNITSNTVVALQQIAERRLAETISAGMGRNAGGGVAAGEAAAMMHGMIEANKDMFRLAWKAIRTRDATELRLLAGQAGAGSKLDLARGRGISAAAFRLDETGAMGRAVDAIGGLFRVPGSLLMAEDGFFKTIGYRMELHAQAVRQATAEGLADRELAARVVDIVAHPPENIRIAAADAALYTTFTNKNGWFGEAVLRLRGDQYPLSPMWLIMPFIRTPVNIARYSFERTPFAPLTRQWRAEIAAGGARRDIALARLSLGTSVMMMAYDWADSGLITGAMPPDGNPDNRAAWRRLGWQPYSARIGERWYSYNRTDPFGITMGFAADIQGAMRLGEIDADAADEWQELVAMSIAAVSQTGLSKTYLSGLAEFTEVMSDPTRYSEAYVNDLVASFLPFTSLSRAAAGTRDPVLRETGDPLEAVQARIIGLSAQLSARLDLWGEELTRASGLGRTYDFFSPIAARPIKESPIDAELIRLGKQVQRIAKKTSFSGVAVNFRDWPEAYDDYRRLAGNDLRHVAWRLGARDYLDKVVTGKHAMSAAYRVLSDGRDGGKAAFIVNAIADYRRQAQAAILADPAHAAFAGHIQDLRSEKMRRLMPSPENTLGVPR